MLLPLLTSPYKGEGKGGSPYKGEETEWRPHKSLKNQQDNAEELKREGNFRERGDEEATLPIHFRMVRTGGSSRAMEA